MFLFWLKVRGKLVEPTSARPIYQRTGCGLKATSRVLVCCVPESLVSPASASSNSQTARSAECLNQRRTQAVVCQAATYTDVCLYTIMGRVEAVSCYVGACEDVLLEWELEESRCLFLEGVGGLLLVEEFEEELRLVGEDGIAFEFGDERVGVFELELLAYDDGRLEAPILV